MVENQEWGTHVHFIRPVSHTIQAGCFQSVCLDESVYISELSDSSFSDCDSVLHKCNMKKQSYYKLPMQVERYALAVYRSKVVIIGGDIPSSHDRGRSVAPGDGSYPNNQISVLNDDCGLGEKLNSSLQLALQKSVVYKIGKNACAVGYKDLLIVLGGDGPYKTLPLQNKSQEYVRVFNGEN